VKNMEKNKKINFVFGSRLFQIIKDFSMKNKLVAKIVLIVLCVLLSIPAVLLGKSGLFRSVDYLIEDSMYQKGHDHDTDVVVISITSDDIGSGVIDITEMMYNLLNKVYTADSEPSVCGIVYPLQTIGYETSALQLADYCKNKDIVFNQSFSLSNTLIVGDDCKYSKSADSTEIKNFGAPYAQLTKNVKTGYTNLFYDIDGVIRHYAWTFQTKDGKEYNSFAKECYDIYARKTNKVLNPIRTSGENITFIDYCKAPGGFIQYSASDVAKGKVDAKEFKDKIVLIGQCDSALTEGYRTAISRSEVMYNVEIQANEISNAIDGKQVVEMKMVLQLLLLLVFEAAAIYHFLVLPFIKGTIYFAVNMILNFILSYVAKKCGFPYHLLYYVVAYSVTYAISIAISLQKEKIIKSQTNTAINQVIDPKIKETILKDGSKTEIEPMNKNICVMFADLRNFTSVSSSLHSSDLVNMLNEYFTKASECIKENDGTIDKYNGDEIMAFWGAPDDVEDSVFKACKAALDICHSIEDLNKEIYEKYERNLSFGIGINFGEATIGFVGSDKHKEYTAIGDTINIASRVESLAPRGCVYITKIVKEMLGDRARISSFDHKYIIKGKIDPIELYLLEALDERHGYYQIQNINEVTNEL